MSVRRPGLLGQDGVCLARVHDLHQHVQRATVRAEGDGECGCLRRVALQLSLLDAAAAPTGLMHRQEDDAVCADAIGAHLPAQLDEEPVCVGVLLLSRGALSRTWWASCSSSACRARAV